MITSYRASGTMKLMSEKASATIIFDFDGTIADTFDLIYRLYNDHADDYGYEKLSENELPEIRRLGYKKAMKKKGIRYSMVPRMVFTIGKKMRQHMGEVKPHKGMVDVLKQLQAQGFALGILTSNQANLVKDFLDTHKFPKFDFIMSEKTLFGKDKALKRIIKRNGLSLDQVLYIGDEPRDVTASHKAGVQVVGVTWGLGGPEGFEETVPDVIVDSPKELLRAIQKLAQE